MGKKEFLFELVWVLFALISIIIIAVIPYFNFGIYIVFYELLALSILLFLLLRIILFPSKLTWLNGIWPKAVLLFLVIPTIFYIGNFLNDLQTTIDNYGLEVVFNQNTVLAIREANYIRGISFAIGIACIIALIGLPIVLIRKMLLEIRQGKLKKKPKSN